MVMQYLLKYLLSPILQELQVPQDFPIDFKQTSFWIALVTLYCAVYTQPSFRVRRFLGKDLGLGLSKNGHILLEALLSMGANIAIISSYFQGLKNQPELECLQTNYWLMIGHILSIISCLMVANAANTYGWKTIIFGTQSSSFIFEPFYYPCGSALTLLMVGQSIVYAKVAGVCMSVISAVAYVFAFYYESSNVNMEKIDVDVQPLEENKE